MCSERTLIYIDQTVFVHGRQTQDNLQCSGQFCFNEKQSAILKQTIERSKINGLTDKIRMERSTLQGCQLSKPLFARYLEHCNMQDFLAMEMENKIVMYVDDVLLYITSPDLLDTFGT